MDIDRLKSSGPFTSRVLSIMEENTKCLNLVLSKSSLDDETIMEIVARLTMIEGRELAFLTCLQHPNIEEALKDVVVDDEIAFMDASEEYIKIVNEAIREIE